LPFSGMEELLTGLFKAGGISHFLFVDNECSGWLKPSFRKKFA